MASRAPVRKVRVAANSGGLLVVLLGLVDVLTPLQLGHEIVAALVGALVTTGTAYATPALPGDPPAASDT